jgi:hypothetical protein
MRGSSWLSEAACTATAMVLFCVFQIAGLLLLAGLVWLLGTFGVSDLFLPI